MNKNKLRLFWAVWGSQRRTSALNLKRVGSETKVCGVLARLEGRRRLWDLVE